MDADHIALVARNAGIRAQPLVEVERLELLKRLKEQLNVNVTASAPWDDVSAPNGQLRTDGWELIPRYVGTLSCMMFLAGAKTVWEFASGVDLLRVLRECSAFEFYVCDKGASYLLCSNHHDAVVGWGAARPWVDNLPT